MSGSTSLEQATVGTPIPPDILASLVGAESSWNPQARNPKSGASGLGGVLPSTAADPGYGVAPLAPDASPQQQLRFAAQYLAARGKAAGLTDSDWRDPEKAKLALAAYHGPQTDADGVSGQAYAQKVLGMSTSDTASALGGQSTAGVLGAGYGPGMVAGVVGDIESAQREKDAKTGPIYAQMQQDVARDRLNFDKVSKDFKPVDQAPAPKPPESDPLKAFGSAAGIFAMLASAFTHTPAINAMNGMAAAINSAKASDWKSYEANYKTWKDNTELAIQNHKLQAEDMKSAMDVMQHDLSTGVAMAKAVAAQTDDRIATKLLEEGQYEKLAEHQRASGQAAASMQEHALRMQEMHMELEEKLPILKATQDFTEAQKSGDPAKIAAARENYAATKAMMSGQARQGSKEAQFQTLFNDAKAHGKTDAEATIEANTLLAKAGAEGRNQPSGLTPEARKAAAETFILTGQIPGGSRNKADVEAIQNEAAELRSNKGLSTADTVENAAGYKASTQSLGNLTKLSDAAQAQEAAASKELDLVERNIPAAAEKINSQAISRWVQTGQTQFGDTELPKYQAALISALDEYAKIISGSTGAAGSTDAARAQAALLIPSGATSDQIRGIIGIMKQGMQYKTDSYGTQLDVIKKRIGGGAGVSSGAADPPPASSAASHKDGDTATSKSGKPMVFKSGQWVYQ